MGVFDYKNLNGYKSNNPKLLPKVKMQVENLYPIREKIIYNEFGHKIYWVIKYIFKILQMGEK
jgi:hypothetical protein